MRRVAVRRRNRAPRPEPRARRDGPGPVATRAPIVALERQRAIVGDDHVAPQRGDLVQQSVLREVPHLLPLPLLRETHAVGARSFGVSERVARRFFFNRRFALFFVVGVFHEDVFVQERVQRDQLPRVRRVQVVLARLHRHGPRAGDGAQVRRVSPLRERRPRAREPLEHSRRARRHRVSQEALERRRRRERRDGFASARQRKQSRATRAVRLGVFFSVVTRRRYAVRVERKHF